MSAKVPNVKKQHQQQQQEQQQQTKPKSLPSKNNKTSSNNSTTTTTTKAATHKSSSKTTKMTTTSGFVAPNTSTMSASAGADLNHTATEAKEVEAVDVASDAFYCGSSAQETQKQQQQPETETETEDPQPPPRAAPRGNPPTPKPRSVLPPTTTLMTTTTPATTLNYSSSSATLKSAAAAATTAPAHATVNALKLTENVEPHLTPRSKQRLIKVDFSLLQDDDNFFDEPSSTVRYGNSHSAHVGICSQPQMPPYPIGGYMTLGAGYGGPASAVTNANVKGHAPTAQLPSALTSRVLRRTSI